MVETRVSTDRSSEELSPYKKTYSKETIMRQRKKSEDLSIFETPCRNKDVYINCKFFDLFDVAEKLGEGSQSIVRRCIEIASKKSFAVKLFRNSDVELISTLKTQYKILKVLSHPNIIEAHNLFVNEQERNCQLVLDYCPYPQLKDFLDRNGRL
jgi:serine/threonine protein kinase